MVGGIVAGLLYLLLLWRREGLQRMMPSANDLDRVTYKIICIAFPLLTLMIAAGAYWANQAWGSYWSWDPKETWAAITWLVYAGYLHMRITRGWKGRRAAWFAILGFAVVIFTFFGVTYAYQASRLCSRLTHGGGLRLQLRRRLLLIADSARGT